MSLALQLADEADALTLDRFGALDLRVDTKPDLTPVTDADRSVESALRDILSQRSARRLGARRRVRRHSGFHRPAVGDRPDRRHQELRPRRAGVGDADRADARRRSGRRRGERAGAAAPLVGRRRRRRVRVVPGGRTTARVGVLGRPTSSRPACRSPACRAGPSCGLRDRFIDLTDAVWRVRGYGDFLSYCLVAEGAVDIAAEPEVIAVGPRAARHPGARGGRLVHQPGRHRRGRTAAAPWPPTDCSTKRF